MRFATQLDSNCEHRVPSGDLPARFVARARTWPIGMERSSHLVLHLACQSNLMFGHLHGGDVVEKVRDTSDSH